MTGHFCPIENLCKFKRLGLQSTVWYNLFLIAAEMRESAQFTLYIDPKKAEKIGEDERKRRQLQSFICTYAEKQLSIERLCSWNQISFFTIPYVFSEIKSNSILLAWIIFWRLNWSWKSYESLKAFRKGLRFGTSEGSSTKEMFLKLF